VKSNPSFFCLFVLITDPVRLRPSSMLFHSGFRSPPTSAPIFLYPLARGVAAISSEFPYEHRLPPPRLPLFSLFYCVWRPRSLSPIVLASNWSEQCLTLRCGLASLCKELSSSLFYPPAAPDPWTILFLLPVFFPFLASVVGGDFSFPFFWLLDQITTTPYCNSFHGFNWALSSFPA